MNTFEDIRFFSDEEVQKEIKTLAKHPMFKALLQFSFPDKNQDELDELVGSINSVQDFHEKVAIQTIYNVLSKTSTGFSTSGIEKLEDKQSYLFISNHRDILLDTSLLNISLLKHGKVMTASAIGDNLVQKSFLLKLSKLNRNFLVKRNSSPRELLQNSKILSEYIKYLIVNEKRSVWIAQREGRTKDGNDTTQSGVLKMIAMAANDEDILTYLQSLRIVPVSISYEYDPTDKLKIPQFLAMLNEEEYIKNKNEDFVNIMSGIMGQKRRIHLHVCDDISSEIKALASKELTANKKILEIAAIIDKSIRGNYKLWPTNYIAYDLLHQVDTFKEYYTEEEKQVFLRRLDMRVNKTNKLLVDKFLEIYANPVKNSLNNGE